VPVLGICYGMQTMAAQLGGKVRNRQATMNTVTLRLRARGHSALLAMTCRTALIPTAKVWLDVWMSHGDRVVELPPGFKDDLRQRLDAGGRHG
jgi:GMP synthase (glutamine-hydrolysing)